jgi:hypothetical protein
MTTEPAGEILADQVSRTDLLLGRRGAVRSLADVGDWFNDRPVSIHADANTSSTGSGQAALLTLVTLLHRAGFPVFLNGTFDDVVIDRGPFRGCNLATTLTSLGAAAGPSPDVEAPGYRSVLIGATAEVPSPSVQLTWDGWIAAVRPGGTRLKERDGCPVAPILAAALTVSEIFESHLGVRDACWRDVTISLWNPTGPETTPSHGPALRWLPRSWMLLGLGHLGQANAWCLAHLPAAADCEIWLADDERITASNVSTGVLTHPEHLARPPSATHKTRLVAEALERAGLETRLIERRVHHEERYRTDLPGVALVGVDNLATRRALSDFGWPLCVDAGLGSTASSYDTLSLHVFDGSGRASHEIDAWQERTSAKPDTDAEFFDDLRSAGLDECGVVTLANKNVACAYVGMTAACLSIAEVLRRFHGGDGASTISVALDALIVRGDCDARSVPRIALCPVPEGG